MADDTPQQSRRRFIQKAAYVVPAVVTLPVSPAHAKPGSIKPTPTPLPLPSTTTS